jgi:hypothetical protein
MSHKCNLPDCYFKGRTKSSLYKQGDILDFRGKNRKFPCDYVLVKLVSYFELQIYKYIEKGGEIENEKDILQTSGKRE